MSTSKHTIRFPGESQAYRTARDKLLDAEIELRRQIETVAVQRRALSIVLSYTTPHLTLARIPGMSISSHARGAR
ncbi:MAG TPA: hypothetical protein VNU46_05525 [Gemmatimonadaceae bacterium]|jgi:predicted dithiol-disulfide oxidoreductase (DUF899 family)|nr:hypothetical protein [Gemmatimonadaceae bacterium]